MSNFNFYIQFSFNWIIFCFRDTYIPRNEAETINDHNDKCIRRATLWYQKHLPKLKIVLLTDDRNNRERAIAEKIPAHTGTF